MDNQVFVFKVALKYAKRIWRRIAIPGDHTLADLHDAIFDAFDRFDEHLYSFYFTANPSSKSRSRLRGVPEYTHPHSQTGNNAAATRISSLRLNLKDRFEYLFDYGDDCWHEITLEETRPMETGQTYPQVIAARGDSPPQYPDMEEE
ncbi:MAG: plasmid pRiA4b ORF-3 family protein [Candidatus Euphemobacter frigidus]|nr:plasmid pRiA4b ORF-3 family protein [Candidatus Euphemobacter frigidus]MDP8276307.1 plasmid pRiA4b ORF-3 family protein [Candidatus Euphemobacter frigidus]